jgi:glyoxylase-like metal-dependent hydrolase (beta-lactamase superfamily II)
MEFELKQWTDHIYQFQDKYGYCSLLVTGSERAILFDTMSGDFNLAEQAKNVTSLPVLVINSHGHLDHTAGNIYFDKVFMHPDDWNIITRYYGDLHNLPQEVKQAHTKLVEWAAIQGHLNPILPGERFELGNYPVEVVGLPGHTRGSIGLYCPNEKILLSGDAISPQMCLFFEESLSVEQYVQTLNSVQNMGADFFITGHHMKMFPTDILDRFIQCAMLPCGKQKSVPYEYSVNTAIKGSAYFLDYRNPKIDEMICVIVPQNK